MRIQHFNGHSRTDGDNRNPKRRFTVLRCLVIGLFTVVVSGVPASGQIRLNLSGGRSGIAVGPGGSGVIGRFSGSGFQGIAVGQPGNVQVLPRSARSSVGVVVVGSRPERVLPPPVTRRPCPFPVTTAPTPINSVPHVEVGPDRVLVDTGVSLEEELAAIQRLMRSGDEKTAHERASEVLGMYPDSPEALHAWSLTRFVAGEFDDAAAASYDAHSLQVRWQWNDVRQFFASHDDYLKPLRKLQQSSVESPESPALHFLLSAHYVMIGSPNRARSSIAKTSALMPEDEVVAALQSMLPPVLADAD